jgi:hypothetical protein
MFGVIDGAYYCNTNRQQELNNRIYERNIPSESLKPEFTPRPEQTKFTILGKSNPLQNKGCVSSKPYANFTPTKIFYPGNTQAPWYGFASNINTESSLRNQFFALQQGDQPNFVPSTNSELYTATIISQPMPQPHPHLFRKDDFDPFNSNYLGLGKQLFHNHTQQQLKDL